MHNTAAATSPFTYHHCQYIITNIIIPSLLYIIGVISTPASLSKVKLSMNLQPILHCNTYTRPICTIHSNYLKQVSSLEIQTCAGPRPHRAVNENDPGSGRSEGMARAGSQQTLEVSET